MTDIAPPQQAPAQPPTVSEKLGEWERERNLHLDHRTAVYVSTPITTGPTFLEWFRRVGNHLRRDSPEYQTALRSDVVLPNVQRAAQFIELLRWHRVGLIIDPTAVEVPGWDQATYHEFWQCVLERHARRVIFLNGWALSRGCTLEYETAQQLGLDCVDEAFGPLPRAQGLRLIEASQAEAEAVGLDATYLSEVAARLRSRTSLASSHADRELYKDEVLDHLAHTANVAQFVSFAPRPGLEQRFCRIRGFTPNHRFRSANDAVAALLERSPEGAVNIRSYNPQRPESNPFLCGFRDVDSALATMRQLSQGQGLFTIVNETINQSDGGVSGVSYRGIIEFAPDTTPRCVDDETVETIALPFEMGMASLRIVYGLEPDLRGREGARVEFSIHPRPRGWMPSHTVLWQSEQRPANTLRTDIVWPNRFSRLLGDKAFGLVMGAAAGLRIPRTVVFCRRLFPFGFGEPTGSGRMWTRPCPEIKAPGFYPSTRGWVDPIAALRDWTILDPQARTRSSIAGIPALASVLVQEAIEAQYSGRAMRAPDGTIEIAGTRGEGGAFMVGDAGAEALPAEVQHNVEVVVRAAHESLGPVDIEWVYDRSGVRVVQLNMTRWKVNDMTSDETTNWVRFLFSKGRLEDFREAVLALRGSGRGVVVVGNVSPLSHLGDIAKEHGVPAQFVRE